MQSALVPKNLDVYVLMKSYLIFPIMTGSIDSLIKKRGSVFLTRLRNTGLRGTQHK